MKATDLLTPWYRRFPFGNASGNGADEPGSLSATPILDHRSSEIMRLVDRARHLARSPQPIHVLEAAHSLIAHEVKAVYAMEERTAASRIVARGSGSCSQRLAVLECAARAIGVPTRVRALLIDGTFWHPRFPHLKAALPSGVLLVWPEFDVDGWRSASELFGSIGCRGGDPFSNQGSETLFEAAGRCAVDWDGKATGPFDLSRYVRADHGYFTHRDDAFRLLGQTLCTPSRAVADPVLRRFAAA